MCVQELSAVLADDGFGNPLIVQNPEYFFTCLADDTQLFLSAGLLGQENGVFNKQLYIYQTLWNNLCANGNASGCQKGTETFKPDFLLP